MDIIISLIGAFIFYAFAIYFYKYASGKHKIKNKANQEKYNLWVNNHGQTIKKALKIIMILFGIIFLTQIVFDILN